MPFQKQSIHRTIRRIWMKGSYSVHYEGRVQYHLESRKKYLVFILYLRLPPQSLSYITL